MALIPGLTFKKIFKGIGSIAGAVLGVGKKTAAPPAQPTIQVQAPPAPTPAPINYMPFIIGGVALVALFFFMKK